MYASIPSMYRGDPFFNRNPVEFPSGRLFLRHFFGPAPVHPFKIEVIALHAARLPDQQRDILGRSADYSPRTVILSQVSHHVGGMREGQYMPRRGLFEASTRRHNRLGDHLQAVVIDLFLHLVADRAVPVNQEIEVARTERIEAHHLVGIIDDLFGILERQTVFGLGDQQQQFILYLRFIERFVFGLPGIAVIEMPVFAGDDCTAAQ